MIVVAVMDGQLPEVVAIELAPAAATDMRVHLQRLFPVALVAGITITPRVSHQLFQPVLVRCHRIDPVTIPVTCIRGAA